MRNPTDHRPYIAKWVITALLFVPIASSQALFAQDSEDTTASSTAGGTDLGRNEAMLVANLAEYGQENEDAMVLVAASSILDRMDAGVARRDGTHNLGDIDHGPNGLFTVDGLLAQAREIANNLDADSARDVHNIIERLYNHEEKGYLGYLHTHYVWVCDAWGYCGYRWTSHY